MTKVSYEERKRLVDQAMDIEARVEKQFSRPDRWFQKLPWWEKIDILAHRFYHTYISPLWRSLNRWSERQGRGYAGAEVWDFYSYHAEWVLPRLKKLRDNVGGTPFKEGQGFLGEAYTLEEWKEIINKMCRAFWLVQKRDDDFVMECDPLTYELIDEGLQLFAKHYLNLWD